MELNNSINKDWLLIINKKSLNELKNGSYRETVYDSIPAEISKEKFNTNWLVKEISLPNCWENSGIYKSFTGPVWYFKKFSVDNDILASEEKMILHFNAVSFFCKIWLNDHLIGQHRGMWSGFSYDITKYLKKKNRLIIEIHKPGDLFPTEESLVGFIPYVTSTFGGIWQNIEIHHSSYLLESFCANYIDNKNIEIICELKSYTNFKEEVTLEMVIGKTAVNAKQTFAPGINIFKKRIKIDNIILWSAENPFTYDFELNIKNRKKSYSFSNSLGIKNIEIDKSQIKINDEPIYIRGVLNWLSYTDTIAPILTKKRIKEELIKFKALGFNLVKLCLVIPSDEFFEAANELGIYIWLEFPMWLPRVTENFKDLALTEYRNIAKRVRQHPSLIIYTLGCELDAEVDGEFLNILTEEIRQITGSKLLAQNSGSGEAYGGAETEIADFYDYHFYTEPYRFTQLYNYFYPQCKNKKPLLFGEYCDSDTFRSIADLKKKLSKSELWWTKECNLENPKGIRWEYNIVNNEKAVADLLTNWPAITLTEFSQLKAFESRKNVIEQTRKLNTTSGYVITVNIDTPISSSGIIDDLGKIKYPIEKFKAFNSNCVITFETDKRRVFQHGDKPQYIDEYNIWQGELFSISLIVSNFEQLLENPILNYTFKFKNSTAKESLIINESIPKGCVKKIAKISIKIPETLKNYEFDLDIALSNNNNIITQNNWSFNALKKVKYDQWRFYLLDYNNYFYGIDKKAENIKKISFPDIMEVIENQQPRIAEDNNIYVFSSWTYAVEKFIEKRKKIILICSNGSPFTEENSFFRESAVFLEEKSFLQGNFLKDHIGIAYKSVAPERSMSLIFTEEYLNIQLEPVITRIDIPKCTESYYMLKGSNIIITTLNLFGGSAGQSTGVDSNVMGTYIFNELISYLK
ncbi:MAG TPA: glycoside hydrolase family 2 TIM barrel-domain containing protein [Victivallales bacterium]|nr:glycoside hydrolase family 2 TIM barrel-domain containing protein [Victivallales bacterium]